MEFRKPLGTDSMEDHAEQHAFAFDEIKDINTAIKSLQDQLQSLNDVKTSGLWTETRSLPTQEGEAYFIGGLTFAEINQIAINEVDAHGWTFSHAGWDVGDYISVIEYEGIDGVTETTERSIDEIIEDNETGHFGLYVIDSVNEDGTVDVTPVAAVGDTFEGDIVSIQVFHLQEDINIGQLDDRYAFKEHEHSKYIEEEDANSEYKDWLLRANGSKKNPADFAPAHSHPYASSSHTHSYASSSHTHNYASSSHTHSYASSGHNHNSSYAGINHEHSGVTMRRGTSSSPSLMQGEMYLNTTHKVVYVGY